jgi:2-hydroxychromene-2-carboxylate isomerase
LPAAEPATYFDLGSPYAYLALARAITVLGVQPELRPVLLGAIFARRGFGSWGHTQAREARMAEIEQRALRYGLAPLRWPDAWPADGLLAMRCATWACERGRGEAFARAVFDSQFRLGADIADLDVLLDCADQAGLDVGELQASLGQAELKDSLRQATERAWQAGVRGVPTTPIGELLFYGEDQLELASEALRGAEQDSVGSRRSG